MEFRLRNAVSMAIWWPGQQSAATTRTDNKVAFQTNSINLNTSTLERRDELLRSCALSSRILDIVVVIVKLDAQSVLLDRLLSSRERHWHLLLADRVEPDVASIAASRGVRESLIQNVPATASVTEVFNKLCDVLSKYSRKRSIRPVLWRVRDPIGKLVGPDQVVATNQLAGGLGQVQEVVAASKVEDVLFWFCVFELKKHQSVNLEPLNRSI